MPYAGPAYPNNGNNSRAYGDPTSTSDPRSRSGVSAQQPQAQVSGPSDYQASQVAPTSAAQQSAVATPQLQSQLPQYSYDLNSVNPDANLGYQTFLGGYGYDKSSAQAQANYKNQSLAAQLAQGIPGFETERQDGVLNANEAAGQRGAIRSSSNLLSQDNVVRDVNSKEAAFRQGIADQQAQTAFGLQDTLNQLEQSRAQKELQARQEMLQVQNRQVAYNQAAAQYGLDPATASLLSFGYNGGTDSGAFNG